MNIFDGGNLLKQEDPENKGGYPLSDKHKTIKFLEEIDNPDDFEAEPVGKAKGDEDTLVAYDNPDDVDADIKGENIKGPSVFLS